MTTRRAKSGIGIGGRLAPPRFLAFLAAAALGIGIGVPLLGWREGGMAGFDAAVLFFLAICAPLLKMEARAMREAAKRNDANRVLLLVITGIVMLAVLIAIAAELAQEGKSTPAAAALVVGTLALAWLFSNVVYALHYAHLFYTSGENGKDRGGITFPGTDEPDYWDFLYFASCLGMTFQTSDMDIEERHIRRVVTFHCMAAFVFNLGVVAFTINVLGGG